MRKPSPQKLLRLIQDPRAFRGLDRFVERILAIADHYLPKHRKQPRKLAKTA